METCVPTFPPFLDRRRLLHDSRLPLEKSWPALDLKRLPARVVQQARSLLEGSFVDRHENVLVFGQPGSGKTHLLCAIGQELVRAGRKVLFRKCGLLVGRQPHRLAVGRAIPWSGCVPAEPASVSPGEARIAADGFPGQCQSGQRTGKAIVADIFKR
jgi:hypothetical protein